MTLRRIGEEYPACLHPEHGPARLVWMRPGIYEHVCPGCQKSVTFLVGEKRFQTNLVPWPTRRRKKS